MPSFTTEIIRQAEREFIIPSSLALVQELYQFGIYLPLKLSTTTSTTNLEINE